MSIIFVNLKPKNLYTGSLKGGFRAAYKLSRISMEKPTGVVLLEKLGQSPFSKRLSDIGCLGLNINQPISTLKAFKKLYGAARLSKGTSLIIDSEIDLRMRNEGLGWVVDALPKGILNQFTSMSLPLEKSDNPKLADLKKDKKTVTLAEFYAKDRLNIIDHTLECFKSLELFKNARRLHEKGELEGVLRDRGSKIYVGKDGLMPSLTIILELSDLINEFLSNKTIGSAFLAAMFIHDAGKFIRQSGHPESSYAAIKTFPEIRNILQKHFTAFQMEIIEITARYHSLLTDVHACKEEHILKPYEAVLGGYSDKESQSIINNIIYIHSLCDCDGFSPGESRLSNERLESLHGTYLDIKEKIASNKTSMDNEEELKDLFLDWGKQRFKFWITNEADLKEGKVENSKILAESELSQILKTEEEIAKFYLTLGKVKFVGLIFDLKKEIEDPILRTRLLVWLCSLIEKTGEERFEFRIYREKGKWIGRQVSFMNEALRHPTFIEELNTALEIKKKPNSPIEIIFPFEK